MDVPLMGSSTNGPAPTPAPLGPLPNTAARTLLAAYQRDYRTFAMTVCSEVPLSDFDAAWARHSYADAELAAVVAHLDCYRPEDVSRLAGLVVGMRVYLDSAETLEDRVALLSHGVTQLSAALNRMGLLA